MIFKFHIPTEQYGYMEVELEYDSVPEAMIEYKLMVGNQDGLNDKEFNALLDEYLGTGGVRNGVERYVKLNRSQQTIIQTIKRSIKRIEYKNNKV